MNIFTKILEKLKKLFQGEHWAGLYIKPSGKYNFIEIKKIKNSYVPVFWKKDLLENFDKPKLFKKKKFIEKLKKIKSQSNTKIIFLNSLENKIIEKKIISAIKISGFEKVIIKEDNQEGVILNSKSFIKELTVIFQKENIIFYISDGKKVLKKEEINMEDFSVSKVLEITKNFEIKKVSLVKVNKEILESVKNIFYVAGFKTNTKNIWENFLDFSDGIPGIFLDDSHDFINVLSITVPNLKNWKEKKEIKNIISPKEKKIYLPKKKKNIYLHKPKTLEKKITDEKKNKKFLPKKKKIIFLPKNKSKNSKNNFWENLKNKNLFNFKITPKKKKKSLLKRKKEIEIKKYKYKRKEKIKKSVKI